MVCELYVLVDGIGRESAKMAVIEEKMSEIQ